MKAEAARQAALGANFAYVTEASLALAEEVQGELGPDAPLSAWMERCVERATADLAPDLLEAARAR